MSSITEKSLISSYYVVQHTNITISIYLLQRFGSEFFKPYYVWVFTQAWRYNIHSWYFPQWMQNTSSCKISNLYIENKYHHLALENKFRLLLNKSVPSPAYTSCKNNATVTSKQRCDDVWCNYDVSITSFICWDIYITFCMSRLIHITATCHFV